MFAWFENLTYLKADVHATVSLRCGEYSQVCTSDWFKQQTTKSGGVFSEGAGGENKHYTSVYG